MTPDERLRFKASEDRKINFQRGCQGQWTGKLNKRNKGAKCPLERRWWRVRQNREVRLKAWNRDTGVMGVGVLGCDWPQRTRRECVCCMSIQILSHSRASIQVKASFSARHSLQQQREADYREGRARISNSRICFYLSCNQLSILQLFPVRSNATVHRSYPSRSFHLTPVSSSTVPEGTLTTQYLWVSRLLPGSPVPRSPPWLTQGMGNLTALVT